MIRMIVAAIAIGAAVAGASAADLQDRMEFPSSAGTVVFYHNNHVNEVQGSCAACHSQTPEGKIDGFGADYAHKVCVACHSNPSFAEGPTKCEGCHKQ